MNYKLGKFLRFLNIAHYKRTLTVLVLLIILAAIPLTVYIAQKQQEIRQRADGPKTCTQCQIDIDSCYSTCEEPGSENYYQCIKNCANERDTCLSTCVPDPTPTPSCSGTSCYTGNQCDRDLADIECAARYGEGASCSSTNPGPRGNGCIGGGAISTPTPTTPPGCPITTCRYIRTNQVCLDRTGTDREWAWGTSATGCEGDDCSDCTPVSQNCSQPACILPTATPTRTSTVPNPCVDMPDWQSKCSDNPACEPYSGIPGDKEACSIKNDQCLRNRQLNSVTCKEDSSCEWHPRGFCYTKELSSSPPTSTPGPTSGGVPPTNTPTPATTGGGNCSVSWTLDPAKPLGANTDFRAYIKGVSSRNAQNENDWSHIGFKFDDGNLGAISDIRDEGSLGPLSGCSVTQPCFKSNVLNSGAVGSSHTLKFFVRNNSECTPPESFTTGAGGPTGTPTPTPTLAPNTTRLALTLSLPERSCVPNKSGSGGCIDEGNAIPSRTTRSVIVEVFDQNEQKVSQGSGNILFDQTSGLVRTFKGSADIPNLASGSYIIKVKADKFLKKRIGGIITINKDVSNQLPTTSLLIGDINGDNKRNIDDYNTLLNCYGAKANTPSCGTFKDKADLNDDGRVDNADYGLFISTFSLLEGD